MDIRAQQARDYHLKSQESTAEAARYREQRDRIVRQLRDSDPPWSYGKIAAAVGCSRELIVLILKQPAVLGSVAPGCGAGGDLRPFGLIQSRHESPGDGDEGGPDALLAPGTGWVHLGG